MSNRTLACREVVEAHLARIDEANPSLNALVAAADRESCLEGAGRLLRRWA
jgi:amidase